MNNLKERIAKAFGKYDVVVVSGSYEFGKTNFLKEFVKDNGVCVANVSKAILQKYIENNEVIAIDDVRGELLYNEIRKIQEAMAVKNKRSKILIATNTYDKTSVESALLKIKHFRLRKERKKPNPDNDIRTVEIDLEKMKGMEDILYSELKLAKHEIQELRSSVSQHENESKELAEDNFHKILIIKESKSVISHLQDKIEVAYEDNENIKLSYEKAVSSLRNEIGCLIEGMAKLTKENNHLVNIIRSMK